MKVALINNDFPPYISGIGSYTRDLAVKLSKKGIKVVVITANYNNKDRLEQVNKNLRVYRLKTPDFIPRFVWFQLFNKKKIKFILKKEKPSILHGQEASCAFLLSNKIFKGKKIVTFHGSARCDFKEFCSCPLKFMTKKDFLIHFLGYPLWHYLGKKEAKNTNKHLTFTPYIAEQIKKDFKIKKQIKIIHQGIDLNKIKRSSKNKTKLDNSLIFAGRLVWRKGIIYLLKAIKVVVKELPDIKFKFIGSGPLANQITNFAKQNDLEKNILFYGQIKNEQLIKEIKKSHFATLPSLFEAESVLMMEVMACKKPIVAFDLPFIKSTLNSSFAVLTKKDPKELAKAIISLVKDKKRIKKLGNKARKKVLKEHNWDRLIQDYIKVYKEVLNE